MTVYVHGDVHACSDGVSFTKDTHAQGGRGGADCCPGRGNQSTVNYFLRSAEVVLTNAYTRTYKHGNRHVIDGRGCFLACTYRRITGVNKNFRFFFYKHTRYNVRAVYYSLR